MNIEERRQQAIIATLKKIIADQAFGLAELNGEVEALRAELEAVKNPSEEPLAP